VGLGGLLTAAWLLPMLRWPHVPSVDGPAHVAVAAALRSLVLEQHSPLANDLQVIALPLPYWLAPATLATLLEFVSPPVAEKLVFGIEFLGFVLAIAALRKVVHRRAGAPTWLAFPLAAHFLFRMGFHSFALGVPLALATVACWWSNRQRRDLRWLPGLAALLGATWFAHPLPWLVAVATIAVALFGLRDAPARVTWGTCGVLAAFVPLVWLTASDALGSGRTNLSAPGVALRELSRGLPLAGLGAAERLPSLAVFVALAILIVGSLVLSRRNLPTPVWPLALIALGLAAASFFGPDELGQGTLIRPRFQLLALALTLAAVREPPSRVGRLACLSLVLVIAARQPFAAGKLYKFQSRHVEALLKRLTPLHAGERLLVVRSQRSLRHQYWAPDDVELHAAGWASAAHAALDRRNHLFVKTFSPVRLRDAGRRTATLLGGLQRQGYDLDRARGIADVVCLLEFSSAERHDFVERYGLKRRDGPASCLYDLAPGPENRTRPQTGASRPSP